jgi:hypothetical protein
VTATDLALVVVVVAAVAAVAAVMATTVVLIRSARALRATLAAVERDLAATRDAVARADAGARRADDVAAHAELLTDELRASSGLVRRFAVTPAVWVAAVLRGTWRAVTGLFGSRRSARSRRVARRRRGGGGSRP